MSMSDKDPNYVRLLGLSGSLRRASYSTAILRELQAELGAGASLKLGDVRLPLYNEDEDGVNCEASVQAFRRALSEADGLVISTPEYSHGVSGVLKNALDWASRPSGKAALQNKPVLIISSSPAFTGGVRAQAQINEALLAIGAVIVPGRQIVIGGIADKIKDGEFLDKNNLAFALTAMHRLIDFCRRLVVA